MANANPTWGAPRIHGELLKLGIDLAESTVAAYMPKRRRPPAPSMSWRSMARLHLEATSGMDFFTIPTAPFSMLHGFAVIDHASRALQHVNVSAHPTAEWTKQQLREAFAHQTPARLHRDNDRIYGDAVKRLITNFGIEDRPSAPRSPWQNPYAERVIGSVSRELFDHPIVLNEGHARRLLRKYQRYYNQSRTHLSLGEDATWAAGDRSRRRVIESLRFRNSSGCIIATSVERRRQQQLEVRFRAGAEGRVYPRHGRYSIFRDQFVNDAAFDAPHDARREYSGGTGFSRLRVTMSSTTSSASGGRPPPRRPEWKLRNTLDHRRMVWAVSERK
jgi:transposase InsO family protein